MEALRKAPDPRFDEKTILDFLVLFFFIFVKKIIRKIGTVGFTGGKSRGLVDGVVGNQVHGGGKLPGALLGSQESPGGLKQGFWGGPRGLGPPRAPPAGGPYFPGLGN